MNILSRTISGIIIIIIGIYLSFFSYLSITENWPMFIWGVVLIVLGFVILFNKKEDDIEKIKEKN